MLLFAGYDSVADAIDLGTLLLLTNVDQREAIVRDPRLVHRGRGDPACGGTRRARTAPYAREDIEIGGVTIRVGEAMLLDTTLANFDDRVFDEPDRFDVTRAPNPHVAFGHGPRGTASGRRWPASSCGRCRKPDPPLPHDAPGRADGTASRQRRRVHQHAGRTSRHLVTGREQTGPTKDATATA